MKYDALPFRKSSARNEYYKFDKYVEEEYAKGKSLAAIYAVENAISISNGIVEGFVNKLKTNKRVMYGRPGLELLKRKMILSNR